MWGWEVRQSLAANPSLRASSGCSSPSPGRWSRSGQTPRRSRLHGKVTGQERSPEWKQDLSPGSAAQMDNGVRLKGRKQARNSKEKKNLFARQQRRCRQTGQTYGRSRGSRGWDKLREQQGNIHITKGKTDSQWEFAVWCRELNLGLCDNLEGSCGVGGGRELQGGRDICIPTADSRWCMGETNTIL